MVGSETDVETIGLPLVGDGIEVIGGELFRFFDVANNGLAGVELGDEGFGLAEGGLSLEDGVVGGDAALVGEGVEFGDAHGDDEEVDGGEIGGGGPIFVFIGDEEEGTAVFFKKIAKDIGFGKGDGGDSDIGDGEWVVGGEFVKVDKFLLLKISEVVPDAEEATEIIGHRGGDVDIGAGFFHGPAFGVEIHFPDTTAHGVVGMPMGVEGGVDVGDSGAIELGFDFFGGVDEDVGAVDEVAGAGAGVGMALLASLGAEGAIAEGFGDGEGSAGAEDF